MKIKTIKLTNGHAPSRQSNTFSSEKEWQAALRYRVEQITDSIEYSPGQLLEKAEVESLCASRDWKVTVVSMKL